MNEAANYIALAIPVFFLLIGVELLVQKLSNTRLYRLNDAVTNISCGVGQQVFFVFIKTAVAIGYIWLYENYRIFELSSSDWWVWVICFLGVDMFYYWFHREAHEISLLWGAHIVHHQSEEYNLSVALRQGAFQTLTSWIFYLPLAVIGFDPVTFVVVNQFQTLYQFWIHTRAINRLPGWFEYVFNTPSHHRVHHGINPQYLDKNHGGTLIIWDRMFGTFEPEREEVVYGVTKPLSSWNPVWANFDYLADLFRLSFKCRNAGDVFRVFFKGPGWRPAYLGGPQTPPQVDPKRHPKYNTPVSAGLSYYVLFQYVLLIVAASVFLFSNSKFGEYFEGWQANFWRVSLAGWIFLSIASLGGLLEKRSWAPWAEVVRVALIGVAGVYLSWESSWQVALTVGAGVFVAGSVAFLRNVLTSPRTVLQKET
jgi:sterol desaturase/sphingolipid hydroxylase (fatty acid hydroxylase superfamily)